MIVATEGFFFGAGIVLSGVLATGFGLSYLTFHLLNKAKQLIQNA